jgi:hypothetical protein
VRESDETMIVLFIVAAAAWVIQAGIITTAIWAAFKWL